MALLTAILGAIGLSQMTNREALLEELAELDTETLAGLLFGTVSELEIQTDDRRCEDCMAAHGGECPKDDDYEPCDMSVNDWLDAPCRHERLIQLEVSE